MKEETRKRRTMNVWIIIMMMMTCGGGGGVEALQYTSEYAQIYRGPKKSEFGFSVSIWKRSRPPSISLMVGAPRSTESDLAGGNTALGALYKCVYDDDDDEKSTCSVIPDLPYVVEEDQQNLKFAGPQVLKNGTMSLGETVIAGSSLLLTCAPRYPVLDTFSHSLQGRGACFLRDNPNRSAKNIFIYSKQVASYITTQNSEVTATSSIANTGYATFGFSASMNSKQSKIFIGAPYAFWGQGVMNYFSKKGSWQSEKQHEKDASTRGYMEGWASTTGYYGKGKEYVAVSRPGYGNLSGQVIFYDMKLSQYVSDKNSSLEGTHLGGWFGYSLASCKVDGDSFSDLLVGAPHDSSNSFVYPDAGIVYLYYTPLSAEAPRESPLALFGEVPWGRFGTSVACVGDLNVDSYEDVAIGAPGAGGRVYIYKGGPNGLHPKPTQVIDASTFFPYTPTSSATFGFGFSIAGGVDLDGNNLTDLLIGAPGHDAVVLLRTPPLVHLEAVVRFQPSEVKLSDRRCQVGEASTPVICAELVVDIAYESEIYHGSLDVDLELSIDPDMHRVSFYDKERDKWLHKHRLEAQIGGQGQNETLSVIVYGQNHRLDFQYPVEATVNASLTPGDSPFSSKHPYPVLDAFFPTTFSSNPPLTLLCEDESSCHANPNLGLEADGPTHLVEGEEHIHLSALITNLNDTAHGITLNVTFPSDLSFQGSNSSSHLPRCFVKEEEDEEKNEEELEEREEKGRSGVSHLTCVFDSQVRQDEQIHLDLKFTLTQSPSEPLPRSAPDSPTHLVFALAVSSDRIDLDTRDNFAIVNVTRVSSVNLYPGSASDPEVVAVRVDEHLKADEMDDEEKRSNISVVRVGPLITHHFVLINSGPTPLHGFQVEVRLPLRYLGAQLLYLVEPPVTLGPLTCDSSHLNLNPFGFALPQGDADEENYTTEPNTVEEEETKEEEIYQVENTTKRRIQRRSVDLTMKISTSSSSPSSLSSSFLSNIASTSPPPPPPPPPPHTFPASSSSSSSYSPTNSSSSPLDTISPSPSPLPPPLPASSPPTVSSVNGANGETNRPKTTFIHSSKAASEVIKCEGRTLRADESARIKVNAYLVAGTVHNLTASEKQEQQHGTSLIFDSTFTVQVSQRCIFVNNKARGSHGNDCYHPTQLEETHDPINDTETNNNTTNDAETTSDPRNDTGTTDDPTKTTYNPQNDSETTSDSQNDLERHSNTQTDDFKNDKETTSSIFETSGVGARLMVGDPAEDKDDVGEDNDTDAGEDDSGSGDEGDNGNEDGDEVLFEVKVVTRVKVLRKGEKTASFEDLQGWQLLVAIIGGLMLLVVISSIMYKVGFFERKKRLTPMQREQMNQRRQQRRSTNRTSDREAARPEINFSNVMVVG